MVLQPNYGGRGFTIRDQKKAFAAGGGQEAYEKLLAKKRASLKPGEKLTDSQKGSIWKQIADRGTRTLQQQGNQESNSRRMIEKRTNREGGQQKMDAARARARQQLLNAGYTSKEIAGMKLGGRAHPAQFAQAHIKKHGNRNAQPEKKPEPEKKLQLEKTPEPEKKPDSEIRTLTNNNRGGSNSGSSDSSGSSSSSSSGSSSSPRRPTGQGSQGFRKGDKDLGKATGIRASGSKTETAKPKSRLEKALSGIGKWEEPKEKPKRNKPTSRFLKKTNNTRRR
jgi:hypothetical protein